MLCTNRLQRPTVLHLTDWRELTSWMPTRAVICCRRFISSSGAASGLFDRRCSLRTWVYRVAHNVATGHVIRQSRIRNKLVSIEEIESMPGGDHELASGQNLALERLSKLIQRLKPLDRQIIVSYLEGMDASSIGEITGLSPANIAMKVHRIKNILKRWFDEGGLHAK